MTESPARGRSIVTRRALVEIVRAAVVGSYGVVGLSDRRPLRRALRVIGLPPRGIEVSVRDGIAIELSITIAHGLPIAEVARQLDSAVRYAVRRAVERDVDRLVVHVNGLRVLPPIPRGRLSEPLGPSEPPTPEPADESADDVVPLSSLARRRGLLRRSADGRPR